MAADIAQHLARPRQRHDGARRLIERVGEEISQRVKREGRVLNELDFLDELDRLGLTCKRVDRDDGFQPQITTDRQSQPFGKRYMTKERVEIAKLNTAGVAISLRAARSATSASKSA